MKINSSHFIDTPFGREFHREGYSPLYSSFEGFYTRNIFRRYKPVVGQPITTCPGATVALRDRVSEDYYWTSKMLPTTTKVIESTHLLIQASYKQEQPRLF